MIINFGHDEVTANDAATRNILIQFWEASTEAIEGGRRYCELTIPENSFEILPYEVGGLSLYRMHSISCTHRIQLDDEEDDYIIQSKQQEGVISRVFRYKRPEMTPHISFYSLHEYPHREFAISCGIQPSLCFPLFKTADCSGHPRGVVELVSTCEQDLENFKQYFESCFFVQKMRMYTSRDYILFNFLRKNDLNPALWQMDHVLTLVCQKFPLRLAQFWVLTNPNSGALSVMSQKSNLDSEELAPLCRFKDACLQTHLNIGEGLVGKTCLFRKSFSCRNITEFNITNYPLAHYARSCVSIACFTIFLRSFFPPFEECVLEFFLPSQELSNYYPQTMSNTLLTTVKEHLPYYTFDLGEELGQVPTLEVINSSSTREIFKQTHKNAVAVINLDELEESPVKRIEPQSLTPKPNRSKEIIDEANTMEINHFSLEITLEEAIRNREYTVAARRVDELLEDVGHDKTTAAGSSSQTRISLPHQEVEVEKVTVDTSVQKLILSEDFSRIKNKGIIVGAENVDRPIQFVSKTSLQDELETEKQAEKKFSYESLSQHLGRPLDDVAKRFGISRSTFKRKCRDLGIKRWQYGRRSTDDNISSKLRERLNAKEPSRRNFTCSGISSMQDKCLNKVATADKRQDPKKMIVEATYYDATIRFELPGFTIAELEDDINERLHLERESFVMKYQDDEGDWISIACDEDLQECVEISKSSNNTTIKMSLDPRVNPQAQ
ncbi:protein NLP7 isoform X1 [Daucus carota subsp. sativus]|uniref:protein NLP7 isoform X1 n=1 Tax=Daucus carota subsp. sativus TaxID=79200 RepID=UPI0030827150